MSVRVRFRHLTGPASGLPAEVGLPAVLGSSADVQVKTAGAMPHHARVFVRGGEIVAQLLDTSSVLRLSGESVREAVLREGDVLELGDGGPQLRLEAADGLGELMLGRPPWKRERPLASLRARVAWTLGPVSTPVRFMLAVGVATALAALGYSQLQDRRMREELARLRESLSASEQERERFAARVAAERERSEADRATLAARIEELREREEALYRQLRDTAAAEAGTLRGELEATRARLATLESERAAGERIVRDYGAGVCLIQGAYVFHDPVGRPLRYKLDDSGASQKDRDGNPLLEPEGRGRVHEVEFVGTGFLVDPRGRVLTNRHIAEPWWNDDFTRSLRERGVEPVLTVLRAFFPSETRAFDLRLVSHSEHADLSLLGLDLEGARVPALPLDRSGKGAVTGQPVVLVGFPAGVEAMLAKIDTEVASSILNGAGTSTGRISEALAERGLVRPSTTQGHIADITDTDVVFDAPTTQGGSGGPLLNRNGEVIGVAYAVLSRFGGNSFAVPVRRALPLVTRAQRPSRPPAEHLPRAKREANGS